MNNNKHDLSTSGANSMKLIQTHSSLSNNYKNYQTHASLSGTLPKEEDFPSKINIWVAILFRTRAY